MESAIINQGLELMLFGMGTVVVFLSLLVLATTMMSRVVARFFPEPEPQPVAPTTPPTDAAMDDSTLVAVISAAIAHHRRKRQ